jgi:cytochrome c-type biogenesis protein CcmH
VILFWVLCSGLLIIALAFILPTLLQIDSKAGDTSEGERREANVAVYRDQLSELKADLQNGIVSKEQFNQDSEEIQRRLLEDVTAVTTDPVKAKPASRSSAYALALAIPLVAVVFYINVGTPKAITSAATAAPEMPPMAGGGGPRTQAQIDANVQKLAERLKANPADPAGWIMLARSYSSSERYGEAAGAYAKATELNPNDADLWAEYAFVSAMASDRKLEGKPSELIAQALKIDPENPKALQLAGTAAFDAKDYKKAIEIWQKVLSKVPPGSDVAQAITDRINEAKQLAGK